MTYNRGLAQTLFHLFNIAWIGLIIISFIFGLLMVLPSTSGSVYSIGFPIVLELEPETYTVLAQNVPTPLSTEILNLEGTVNLNYGSVPSGWLWQSVMFVGLVSILGVTFIFYQLKMLFKVFATRNPLDEKSIHRFRVIGWVLIVITLLSNLTGYINHRVSKSIIVDIEGVNWSYLLNVGISDYYWVIGGLMMFALAELFRYAISVQLERDTLQEEAELLV